jgi:diacylglycerol O-acyltransferase / wax synthase
MTAGERLTRVDRAWLLMDRPTNPMMIVGLIILSDRVTRPRLRELVRRRFLAFERFRCVPVVDKLGGNWVESAQFDIDDHVLCHALPGRVGQQELEALVGELASTPFNTGRPLWTFHLIERYASGSAIIVRIHHAYADGVALVQVLLALADAEIRTGSSPSSRLPRSRAAPPGAAVAGGWLPELISGTLRDGAQLVEKSLRYAMHPGAASVLVQQAAGIAGELAHIGLLTDDPPTRLKAPLSGIRRAAWADPLSFEEVQTIGRVLGCTVNDVLISTLAGAMGRYLEAHGDAVAGITIRATVPVNLRSGSDPQPALGNRFGLVFVDLPVGTRHPLERLYAVRTSMQKLKSSPQALVTLGLLALIGSLPESVEEPAIALFSAKASLVASNLPGPRAQLRLAGAPVSQILFWVPQAGDIGTGVSMLTYNGHVHFGVIADRQLIKEPAELVKLIGVEFERLVFLVLLGGSALRD